jgi:8-oxo-dGTP pyrophosphatase MutT (NUDIX family)
MAETDNPWRRLSGRVVYDNPWIRVEDDRMLGPDGQECVYGLVRFKNRAIGVLPIDADGSVHLVGQWRVPHSRYSWEMPEGGGAMDEAPDAAARRELEEEAGLKAGQLIEILQMDLSNSVTDEQATLYLALDLTTGEKAPDATEVFRHRLVPFRDVLAEVFAGQIRDSLTVAGVLRAYHMAKEGLLAHDLAKAMLEG